MVPNLTIGDLMIDCASAERARNFYSNLTGWEKTVAYDCLAIKTDTGLTILFAETDLPYVPPVWPEEPGEQQKQMHLDFTVDDLPSAVEDAIQLGAVKAAVQYGDWYVTMLDPDGHPFCLCQRQGESEFELYFRTKGFDRIPNPSVNIDGSNRRRHQIPQVNEGIDRLHRVTRVIQAEAPPQRINGAGREKVVRRLLDVLAQERKPPFPGLDQATAVFQLQQRKTVILGLHNNDVGRRMCSFLGTKGIP